MRLNTVAHALSALSTLASEAEKTSFNSYENEDKDRQYIFDRVQQELLALAAAMSSQGLSQKKKV